MYVTKVDVLVNVFDCRGNSDRLIIIVRIKKFYFCNVSSIRIVVFCDLYKIRRFNRFDESRSDTNFIYEILQSISLLFREINILPNSVRHNDK
jgi:hypothetical protein